MNREDFIEWLAEQSLLVEEQKAAQAGQASAPDEDGEGARKDGLTGKVESLNTIFGGRDLRKR